MKESHRLAALALLVRVVYLAWDVNTGRHAIGSVAEALSVQRYSVVLVTLVTVIAAGRGMDILQQMPDVPRAWLTRDGWEPALVAMATEALLAVLLMFLGRMRTRRAKEKYSGTDSRRDPSYVPWLGIPLVLVVLAVLLRLVGVAEVGWARQSAVPEPGAHRGGSLPVRRRGQERAGEHVRAGRWPPGRPPRAHETRLIG